MDSSSSSSDALATMVKADSGAVFARPKSPGGGWSPSASASAPAPSTLEALGGMAVDAKGNLFAANGPGGVLVFDPRGEHIGTIATGGLAATAVAFGGDGTNQFLFITSVGCVMRVPVKTKPPPFPAAGK
jgi:hypothetical protein